MRLTNKKKIVQLICRLRLQRLMQKLHLFALTGMNYGNANALEFADTGEVHAMDYVIKKLSGQQRFVFFDVGANRGDYTKLILSKVQTKQLNIYAFEPVKQTYACLTDNMRDHHQVKTFNLALGDKEETRIIYSSYETSGASTFYPDAIANYTLNKRLAESIHIKTLDAVCMEEKIPVIDFLKIDVEGHELSVLKGAANILSAGKIGFIQFEFGPFNVYSKTFFKDFWNLLSPHYTIYRIITYGLFKISSYSENLEIFRTANFLAELKKDER